MSSVAGREAGFTYIETLIAILIVASLIGGAALFMRGAWTAAMRSMEHSRDLRRIITAERSLRRAAGRIASPWWSNGSSIESVENGYKIVGLDGIDTKSLIVELEASPRPALIIEPAGEDATRLPLPVGSLLVVDHKGATLSVSLGGEEITIRAFWTGRSLYGER